MSLDPEKPTQSTTFTEQGESSLSPEMREARDRLRTQADAVIDWAKQHRSELPPAVTVMEPREGYSVVSLEGDKVNGDESMPVVTITREAHTSAKGEHETGVTPVLSVASISLGELPGTYRKTTLEIPETGSPQTHRAYEEAVLRRGLFFISIPLEPLSSSLSSDQDLKDMAQRIREAGEITGLPSDLFEQAPGSSGGEQ